MPLPVVADHVPGRSGVDPDVVLDPQRLPTLAQGARRNEHPLGIIVARNNVITVTSRN